MAVTIHDVLAGIDYCRQGCTATCYSCPYHAAAGGETPDDLDKCSLWDDARAFLEREAEREKEKNVLGVEEMQGGACLMGDCPSCHRALFTTENIKHQTRFCQYCGQEVKWDD